MSFNTGGHTVYLTAPTTASSPHALTEANGSLLVFTGVSSDGDDLDQEHVSTMFPEQVVRGRIVG
jgi:hypothetical protein